MNNLFVVFAGSDEGGMRMGNAILPNTNTPIGGEDIINIQREIKRMMKKIEPDITDIVLTDCKVL